MMACWTCSASCPSGRCSRIVNLVVRSTSVPMALLLRLPVMEIALPMARDRPVLDLRGSLRDHGHGFAETGFAALAALGSAGGSPLPHGAFQLLLEFAPGLQVDGLVDRLDARVHIPIIREVQPQPVGYLLRAPMPAQPGGDLVPQSRALGRLARFGAFEPVRGLLLGAVRLVTAGLGIPVALDLAADRAGVAAQQAGDGADRIAQTQTVRDLDALLLAQVARMEGLGFVHGGTIPVHQGFLVPSRGARPAVAPRLAGAFRDADRVRGLGEVHAFLVQQAHVLGASRLAHQLPRRIFDAVERPTVFPATVFVSVASGHLTLLAVGQVLQRSLEPAQFLAPLRGGEPSAQQTGGRRPGRRDSTVTDVLFSGFPAEMGTRRAVSLRPRRRGRPGMVPDVGLMSARSPGCFVGVCGFGS